MTIPIDYKKKENSSYIYSHSIPQKKSHHFHDDSITNRTNEKKNHLIFLL